MPRKSVPLELTAEQTKQLERWIRTGSTPQQVALRADIVHRAGRGESDKEIAGCLAVHPRTVALWRRRARSEGIESLWQVAAGRGRKPVFGATTVSGWVDKTLQTRPKGATHWSTRSLARNAATCIFPGLSASKMLVLLGPSTRENEGFLAPEIEIAGVDGLESSSLLDLLSPIEHF